MENDGGSKQAVGRRPFVNESRRTSHTHTHTHTWVVAKKESRDKTRVSPTLVSPKLTLNPLLVAQRDPS